MPCTATCTRLPMANGPRQCSIRPAYGFPLNHHARELPWPTPLFTVQAARRGTRSTQESPITPRNVAVGTTYAVFTSLSAWWCQARVIAVAARTRQCLSVSIMPQPAHREPCLKWCLRTAMRLLLCCGCSSRCPRRHCLSSSPDTSVSRTFPSRPHLHPETAYLAA